MSDEDMLAQIANIEAQISHAQSMNQAGGWQPQAQAPGSFGASSFGTGAPAMQGFPRQQQPTQPPQGQPTSQHQFSKDSDDRSVFIANLPKGPSGAAPEELAAYFQDCGPILTCTVIRDKTTGEFKGTAYIEFATHEAAGRAIDIKNNSNFRGCTLSVSKKRSLFRPGMGRGAAPPARGGGRGRGGMYQPDPMQAMMALMAMSAGMQQFMGRGRGGRGGRGGGGRGGGGGHDGGNFQPFQ